MNEIFKLLFGRIFTNIGDSIVLISLTWYISDTYNDVIYLGYLGFIIGFIELFIIFIGPIIDRYSVNIVLVISTIIQIITISIITILIYQNFLNLTLLYVLIAISVMCSSIIYPAENTVIPVMINNAKEIAKVNSIFQISYKALDLILNSVIGFLLTVILLKNLMNIAIITFCIALYLFFILRIPKKQMDSESQRDENFIFTYFNDLKVGLNYVKKPVLLKLLLPLTLINFAYAGGIVIFPKLGELFGGSIYYGIILLINGIGILIGYLIAPYIIEKISFNKVLPLIFFTMGICWLGLLLSYKEKLIYSIILLLLSSIVLGILNLIFITAFQVIPPKYLLGRVSTTNETLISLLVPFGSLFGSVLADSFSNIGNNFLLVGFVSLIISIFYCIDSDIQNIHRLENIKP